MCTGLSSGSCARPPRPALHGCFQIGVSRVSSHVSCSDYMLELVVRGRRSLPCDSRRMGLGAIGLAGRLLGGRPCALNVNLGAHDLAPQITSRAWPPITTPPRRILDSAPSGTPRDLPSLAQDMIGKMLQSLELPMSHDHIRADVSQTAARTLRMGGVHSDWN